MEAVIILMFFFGAVLAVSGQLWLWMVAYHTDPVWFFVCLVLPFVCALFIVLHPRESRKAVAMWIVGLLLLLAGYWLWQHAENLAVPASFTMPPTTS